MTTLSEVDAPPRRTGFITDRAAGIAASAAGILSVVIGILQVLFPQDEDPAIDPRTRGILVMFTLSLWALAVLFQGLAPHAQRRWGAHVASAGTILLTLGTLTSALNGIDLGIFPVIAMAANALWLVGAIALTVSLVRAQRLSAWLVLPLPFVQIPLLFLSQMGGGVIAGGYLLILGVALLRRRIATHG